MSLASRKLHVGDEVYTGYSGKLTKHEIIEVQRTAESHCQSGVLYKVYPMVPKSSNGWIDADWFTLDSTTLPA